MDIKQLGRTEQRYWDIREKADNVKKDKKKRTAFWYANESWKKAHKALVEARGIANRKPN